MKRSLVAVLTAVCLFAGSNAYALTVEEEIAQLKKEVAAIKGGTSGSISQSLGLIVELGATIVLQGTNKINDGLKKGRHDATYSFDLGFGKEFSNGGIAFVHIEGGAGEGLHGNGLIAYSQVNGDAGNTGNHLEITELWYEQPLFDEMFTVTFGKLNPAGYLDENEFANDETSQFLNSAFVNNAVIALPENSIGVRLTISPVDMVDFTYAYIANDSLNNFDANGFNAVQLNVKPIANGNYRIMYWSSNVEHKKWNDANKILGAYGFGLSVDQEIIENIGVFGRFGWADPEVSENEMSWSVGAQIGGGIWSRENDAVGLAAGQIIPSKKYVDFATEEAIADGADPEYKYKKDAETQIEFYYSFAITENVSISPAAQYIIKPQGGNAADDRDVLIYGIRTQINF